jgi:SAM-dependent methyltransferase
MVARGVQLGRVGRDLADATAGGCFPLLTPAELHGARSRWEQDGPSTAARALRENVDAALLDRQFQAPLQLSLTSNLFQIQNLLLEASLAFCLSGEERFLEPVVKCIVGVADQHTRRARLPSEIHLAFVVVGLAVADELCGEAVDRDLLRARVVDMVGALHDASSREEWGDRVAKRNAWNHTAVAYAAIGCGGLLCQELDSRAELWLTDALEHVRLFFADGVTDQGMTREGLAYCGFAFRNLAPLLLAARNAGVWDYRSPGENAYLERLRRIPRWYAIETLPGGSWVQPINDSYWSPHRAMGGFLPCFGGLDPSLSGWVYRALLGPQGNGTHGRDQGFSASTLFESVLWPQEAGDGAAVDLPEVVADPVVGYIAERVHERPRSGFSLNCGEYIGAIHDQSDNGSVTLFAGDVPLLIDSGAANDPVEGSASSSHGHNVVLIDGRGQFPAGAGAGCSGRVVGAERHPLATVLTVDLEAAYNVRDHNPVQRAIRHCVFGKRPFPYLLIVDDFARPDGQEAIYEQLFHTPPTEQYTQDADGLRMCIEFQGSSCDLAIHALDRGVEQHRTFFAQPDPTLFPLHAVWRLRRVGSQMLMPTLLLPSAEGCSSRVRGILGRDSVTLRWDTDSGSGVDVLRFVAGSAEPATLTRDGRPLADAKRVLAPQPAGRPPVEAGGRTTDGSATGEAGIEEARSSDPLDERALARRRRLRRLLDSVEAYEREGGPTAGEEPGDRDLTPEGALEALERFVTLADLGPDASVLDVKCGSGHFAAPLLHYLRWGPYTGIDAREQKIAWCRERLAPRNPRFRFERVGPNDRSPQGGLSAKDIPSPDESFDFIIAVPFVAVADGGIPAEGCLAELTRVLRDGGVIFLTTSLDPNDVVVDRLHRLLSKLARPGARLSVDSIARGALARMDPAYADIVVLRRGR